MYTSNPHGYSFLARGTTDLVVESTGERDSELSKVRTFGFGFGLGDEAVPCVAHRIGPGSRPVDVCERVARVLTSDRPPVVRRTRQRRVKQRQRRIILSVSELANVTRTSHAHYAPGSVRS